MKQIDLFKIASDFRIAVISLAPFEDLTYFKLSRFPSGSCKTASFLLAHILHTVYKLPKIDYVCGLDSNYNSHGWLEVENLILDVTADQFVEISEPVIVVESSKSDFHQLYQVVTRSPFPVRCTHILHSDATEEFGWYAKPLLEEYLNISRLC